MLYEYSELEESVKYKIKIIQYNLGKQSWFLQKLIKFSDQLYSELWNTWLFG